MTTGLGEAMHYPTLRLVRVGIGPYRLDSLHLGEWQPLSS